MCFYLQNSSFSYMDIRVILNMIPGSKGHAVHASMTLGPVKHEKVARIGRISNVFRIAGAQSA